MKYKCPKPQLIDPTVQERILRTLQGPTVDYWEPVKNIWQYFYEKYIKPNIWYVIIILTIALLLFYRYRSVQNKRENNLK